METVKIFKEEIDNPAIWDTIALELGLSKGETEIEVADAKGKLVIDYPEMKDIDKNLKFYKEARWFIKRMFGFDTMSNEEMIKVCDMAAVLSRHLLNPDN